MEPLEIRGMWWLPDSPDDAQAGILRYDRKTGARLELIGAFGDLSDLMSLATPNHPLILGVGGGKQVTLVDCVTVGSTFSVPGFQSETYRANFVLLGSHFAREDDLRFSEVYTTFDYLPDWISRSGLRQTVFWRKSQPDRYSRSLLGWKRPNPYLAEYENGKIEIRFDYSEGGMQTRTPHPQERVEIVVTPISPLSLSEVLSEAITPWRDLVALGTDKPNNIEYVRLTPHPKSDESPRFVTLRFTPTHVFERDSKRLTSRDMLASFDQLIGKRRFSTLVRDWLRIRAELPRVCTQFFALLHAPEMYIDDRFFASIRAVEHYHGIRISNERVRRNARKEWQGRVARVLKAVSSKDRDWLEKELASSNRPSLRKRLEDIRAELPDAMSQLLTSESVKEIVAARVDLAHLARPDEEVRTGNQLWGLHQALMLVLQLRFLGELGIKPEAAVALISDSPRYRQYLHFATR